MKVIPVRGRQNVYTCNVYLVMGEWKRIEDMHTLIDVGSDPSIIDTLEALNTGVGKNKVDQVVLTHSHSDHTGILTLIKRLYHPKVCAFSPFLDGVDHVLKHGELIRMGDMEFEVIHTPGHTNDSICILNSETGVMFTGDMPFPIRSSQCSYEDGFYQALKHLCQKPVQAIFAGHGNPLLEDVQSQLFESLRNVRNSRENNPQKKWRPTVAAAESVSA